MVREIFYTSRSQTDFYESPKQNTTGDRWNIANDLLSEESLFFSNNFLFRLFHPHSAPLPPIHPYCPSHPRLWHQPAQSSSSLQSPQSLSPSHWYTARMHCAVRRHSNSSAAHTFASRTVTNISRWKDFYKSQHTVVTQGIMFLFEVTWSFSQKSFSHQLRAPDMPFYWTFPDAQKYSKRLSDLLKLS